MSLTTTKSEDQYFVNRFYKFILWWLWEFRYTTILLNWVQSTTPLNVRKQIANSFLKHSDQILIYVKGVSYRYRLCITEISAILVIINLTIQCLSNLRYVHISSEMSAICIWRKLGQKDQTSVNGNYPIYTGNHFKIYILAFNINANVANDRKRSDQKSLTICLGQSKNADSRIRLSGAYRNYSFNLIN